MKGISAMIATVLLIAFTIAIGGIVSIWLTGLTTTQTQQVSNQSTGTLKCTPSLQIDRVESNSAQTTYLINVTYSNPSQQSVTGISISVVTSSGTVVTNSSIGTLSSGTSNFYTIGSYSTLPTLISLTGTCTGLPVSFTCKPSDSCWRGS